MESIIQFRQMMAEQKFFEVQRLVEVQLTLNNETQNELLLIYVEALKAQHKKIPTEHLLRLAEFETAKKNHKFVLELISDLSTIDAEKFFIRILKLKIQAAEDSGQMDELYTCLSDFYMRQFVKQVPAIPHWIGDLVNKYFKHDFNLKLKELALTLLLNDVNKAEELSRELIISCVEKSSPKGTATKLQMIGEVLRSSSNKTHLEIYQNYCFISANGISDKSDYKRLVEMVLFFEDFRFQVLVLNLLHELNLQQDMIEYSASVRKNKDYNFVYFDKFFPHLKTLFVQKPEKKKEDSYSVPTPDLKLTSNYKQDIIPSTFENEESEDEHKFFHLLKYQTYSPDQLCDLAVSFLQSEMPRVALKASEMAMNDSNDDRQFLKASYLKLTCLLQLKDLRAALDTCLEALNRATSTDDVLSFLYGQAEIYIRLNQPKQARTILSKILSIDSQYRLAKERLDKLNEI